MRTRRLTLATDVAVNATLVLLPLRTDLKLTEEVPEIIDGTMTGAKRS